ncbi:unnamed protein product, partial [Rotaria sp. Silwood2]
KSSKDFSSFNKLLLKPS